MVRKYRKIPVNWKCIISIAQKNKLKCLFAKAIKVYGNKNEIACVLDNELIAFSFWACHYYYDNNIIHKTFLALLYLPSTLVVFFIGRSGCLGRQLRESAKIEK
jgi:hypothetical protein